MRKTTVAMTLTLFVVLVGCGARPGLKSYEFEPARGESVDAELGTFLVPETRDRPDSRTIALRFVRFRSTAAEPGPPIVYLAGGPGGSGIDAARGARFPLFMALREFGDVIAFDQRGTGMSGFEALDCDDRFLAPFDEPLDPVKSAHIYAEATRGCIERKRSRGIDIDAYNTRESAADLMDLREFLGADKITLWGISYGTHLALATMKYHGQYIDRAMLAGIEGLHHTWKLPSDQQTLMEEIARLSKSDPAVSAAVPDLIASVQRLLDELERSPKTITATHPLTGEDLDIVVGKYDLQFGLANMLRGPSSFSGMPDVVARIEQGDWLVLALASVTSRMGEGAHSMSAAMDCASGADPSWHERIEREAASALLGEAINFPMRQACDELGIADLGAQFRAPLRSDIPALLISGTLDGRTPVANAAEVLPGLGNAYHLVIEGAGHSDPLFLSSPRILQTMQAFMRGEPVTDTVVTLPPVQFIAPRELASLSEAALSRYVGSYDIEGSGDVRKVIKAGNLLFTRRSGGQPLPIRPISETQFFYEASQTHLEFELDADGAVAGMTMYHDGVTEGEFARKK